MSMPHFIEHPYYFRGVGLFVEEESSTIPPQPSAVIAGRAIESVYRRQLEASPTSMAWSAQTLRHSCAFPSDSRLRILLGCLCSREILGEDLEAGQGAAEQARRIGDQISELEAKLEHARRAQRAWLAGAEGEARVGEQLRQLELHGWKILHDVHWPGRPRANLDHVVIGPGGVLIIDAKNWSGDVRLQDGELRQNSSSRHRHTASVLDQCSAVSVLLEPQHRSLTQGWICLVGQPDLSGTTASGVTIVGVDALVDAVRALPLVLEEASVGIIHDYLKSLLTGPTSPVVATTALLDRTDAASSVLTARRAAAASRPISIPQPTIRRAPRPGSRNRSRRKNQPSCLGAFGRLVLLALALWIGAAMLQSFADSVSTPPAPPGPSIEQVVPIDGAG